MTKYLKFFILLTWQQTINNLRQFLSKTFRCFVILDSITKTNTSVIKLDKVHLKLLSVITTNFTIQNMWSNWPRMTKSQIIHYLDNLSLFHLVIVFIRLMLSVSLVLKMITLCSYYCDLISEMFLSQKCLCIHRCWKSR